MLHLVNGQTSHRKTKEKLAKNVRTAHPYTEERHVGGKKKYCFDDPYRTIWVQLITVHGGLPDDLRNHVTGRRGRVLTTNEKSLLPHAH